MIKGVRKIFSEVAENYEVVNHVLTLGLDIHWRHQAAREAAKTGGSRWLDVCSGTGEMARYLSRLANSRIKIISLDFCYPMMVKAREKDKKGDIFFVEAEAKRLPFADNSFDLITISFATRNITPNKEYLVSHLQEFKRVLKKGGRFFNLETSQPPLKLVQQLFHLYIKITVKPIGS
ncbi:MAG: class I SAM-dependent methyltransferase, partial [Candidatus Aminicenantales bacterium]